ncbi:MAG: TniB family NTP-binding protein [Xanthobacteraceae bacterium]|nr:TniB family NTP-binding protein [Xanthobacteraceae bacterium]
MAVTKPELSNLPDAPDPTAPLRAFLQRKGDRVASVMAKLEACYVRSARDEAIAAQIERLIVNWGKKRFPKRPEGDNNRRAGVGFVVTGGSGSGKTTALDTALVDHEAFPGYGVEGSGCTFVSVLAPAPCTLAQLGNATLEALGYDTDKPLPENEAWKRVRKLVQRKRVAFLHFDDVHNVLQNANAREVKKIQATFRNLLISRSWPVQLVLSGIEETLDIFKKDRQLKRRLKYVVFDDLVAADDAGWIKDAVEDFATAAGLKYVERSGSMTIERLIHAAAYQFGLVFELLIEGIEVAVTADRKKLTITDLETAYADRTAQPDELNIFASPAWQTINPSVIFKKENEENEAGSAEKPENY